MIAFLGTTIPLYIYVVIPYGNSVLSEWYETHPDGSYFRDVPSEQDPGLVLLLPPLVGLNAALLTYSGLARGMKVWCIVRSRRRLDENT